MKEDLVLLLSEVESYVLEGPLFPVLLPLLDGSRTTDDLIAHLNGIADAADVVFGLAYLHEDGHIEEAGNGIVLQPSSVFLRTVGSVDEGWLRRSVETLGVVVSEDAPAGVVVAHDYLAPELRSVNAWARLNRRDWLLCEPHGSELRIGPLFRGARTGCWECLQKRLRVNRFGPLSDLAVEETAARPVLPSAAALSLVVGVAVQWLLRASTAADSDPCTGTIIAIDTPTLTVETHLWTPDGRCPVCGDGLSMRRSEPIQLGSVPKANTWEAGHRSRHPEEVFRDYSRHISRLTGIVRRITPVSDTSHPLIQAYVADHLFVQTNRKSGGKGMTPTQAKASALCEALERYSGMYRGDEDRIAAPLSELGAAAIHPRRLLNFSQRQYAERERWNRRDLKYAHVPEPFQEQVPIDWSPVWSLTEQAWRYAPTAWCYYGYPQADGHQFAVADSNGCASGATREEAVLQGLLEVIERDAVAVWWYNRIPRQRVDLTSVPHPYPASLERHLAGLGLDVAVFDITSDLEVPCMAAVAKRVSEEWGQDMIVGAGCHLDGTIAVCRAMTELNQFLGGFLEGQQRCVVGSGTATALTFLSEREAAPLNPGQAPRGDDFTHDVAWLVGECRARSLEVMLLDQTRDDVELPVVRVIVPGLRHFWPRFGLGRLYDVPIQMKWRREPRAESELNPFLLNI